MKFSQDKQGLIHDLKQRYQYLLDSAYPDDIISFEEETGMPSDDFYLFFSLVAGSLSYVVDHKRIPKKQLNVLRQSFEEQSPQIKSFQHILESYHLLHSYIQYHEETRKRIIALIQ
ncbi:YxiJ-like family protein [Bacillus safensis]|uniref:YxiJ family protein n=1 Tax=Bacillus safensis TaxID=561879 RepID=UPI00227EFC49|nr:YxiJ family protein [Bacillus safensis]MCY7465977.1 YxiJ-like family protein [Bacillus safensis]MED0801105.1 YxiJ family protein [Bacillus safensis]